MNYLRILTLALVVFSCSCSKKDKDQRPQKEYAKVTYSIAGSAVSGVFTIEVNRETSGNSMMAVYPVVADGGFAKAGATVADYDQKVRFDIVTPAKQGLVEILDEASAQYAISFGFEDMELTASSVSVNVTETKLIPISEGSPIQHLLVYKGSFEGVVIYEYDDYDAQGNRIQIKSPHTVSGQFEFINPKE